MNDLPIGSLWRSRHNADIRIITEVDDMFGDNETFMVCYHDVTSGYTAATITSIGEWTYEWIVL
jgi:hypothetical protein